MPQHKPEMPGPERMSSRPLAANDNNEDVKQNMVPEAANDNREGDQVANKSEYVPEEAAVLDIVKAVKGAHTGDMLFMHDIVGKRSADESAHLAHASEKGAAYIKEIQKTFAGNDKVLVLGWKELQQYGVSEGSQNSKEAIKKIAEANPNKIVLAKLDPMDDKGIAGTFKALEHSLAGKMNLTGSDAEEWLKNWAMREQSGKHVEGEPTMEDMRAGCAEALHSLGDLSTDLGKAMRLGLGGSPLALALVVFAAKDSLSYESAKDVFDRPHRTRDSVAFIKVTGNKAKVYFGDEKFERTF